MEKPSSRTPDDANALREAAEAAGADRGRKQEAVDLWRRYVEIVDRPELGEALLDWGRALVQARREREAVDVLRRCAEECPDRFEVHDLLGQVLKRTGSLEEAVAAFRRAAELAPGEVQPRVALVVCLDALGKSEEADAVVRALGERSAQDPALRALVQELLQRRG